MYLLPFREAVLRVYEHFGSMRKAATICKVSVASISRWTRDSRPKARAKRRHGTLSDALVGSVRAFLTERTRCSSLEVVQFIKQSWGFLVSRQLVHLQEDQETRRRRQNQESYDGISNRVL